MTFLAGEHNRGYNFLMLLALTLFTLITGNRLKVKQQELFRDPESHDNNKTHSTFKKLFKTTTITFFSAFTLLLAGRFLIDILEKKDYRTLKAIQSQEFRVQSRELEYQLNKSRDTLYLVKHLLSGRENINRELFTRTAQAVILKNPSFRAMEWVPRVKDSDRNRFIHKHSNLEVIPFTITQRGESGLVPADTRPFYYPVTYIEPLAGNEAAYGYDLYSSELRRWAIDKSLSENEVVFTDPLWLVQEKNSPAFLVIAALENRDLILGVFSAVSLLESIWDSSFTENTGIRIQDTTNSEAMPLFINSHFSLNREIHREEILFEGRRWTAEFNISENSRMPYSYNSTLYFILLIVLMTVTWFIYNIIYDKINLAVSINKATKELRLTNKQLKNATEAKTLFLANMSHEMRTPMNGVIGMINLLLNTELTEEQQEYARTVKYSGESLLTLINDILDISKIEAGKMDLEHLDFNIHTLLENVTSDMAYRARDKNLELICFIDENVPEYLKGDPGRLKQILMNLTGNAVKFTNRGEIYIRCSLEPEEGSLLTLKFTIKDTGIGISREKHASLFDNFTQADTSITRRFGGTGLGLSIARQLVSLLEGEIGFESREGVGSTFWFTSTFHNSASQSTGKTRDLSLLKVLIADSSHTVVQTAAKMLRPTGAHCVTATDSTETMELLTSAYNRGEPFHTAVLSSHSKDITGMDLAEKINAVPVLKNLHLVLMAEPGERQVSFLSSKKYFTTFLYKPLKRQELQNCLYEITNLPGTIIKTKTEAANTLIEESQSPGYNILLVEDNLTNQLVARTILNKLGYNTCVASNGEEALKSLSHEQYDLVLMDIQMPVMDGLQATERIRDIHSNVMNHNIPIVAMTANAMQGDREKCIDAGMNDYMTKPILPEVLNQTLKKWIPGEADMS